MSDDHAVTPSKPITRNPIGGFVLAWLGVINIILNLPSTAAAVAIAEGTSIATATSPATNAHARPHRNDGYPPPVRLRLPETAKYRPADVEELVRQHEDAVANGMPRPVMKLFADAVDAGEKYYFHVDSFGVEANVGVQYLPVNVHFDFTDDDDSSPDGEDALLDKRAGEHSKRQASCPSGSAPCVNISKLGVCCPGGTACVNIQDTGFGTVGCCPNGSPCGSTLSNCAPGYAQCPQGSGGGCCLPGYACSPNGCLIGAGNTVTIAGLPATSVVVVNPNPPVVSTSTGWSTSTVTVAAVAGGLDICQGGYYPCAASLGYGCCRIGYLCGATDCPYYTGPGVPGSEYATSGVTVTLPGGNGGVINPSTIIYPTEGFSTIGTLTVAGVNTQGDAKITNAPGALVAVNGGGCPAGFSQCGAEFNGGCCRAGRACGVSYCPVVQEVVNSVPNGGGPGVVTITTTAGGVVNVGETGDNGLCPTSWICVWDI
ncbi:hypothetical protein Dda_4570 [Drechslerella dactyloides]|uniref:Uncharacterized protein n=1 Tax=Drechslerella dactyloides TaxID=74499 RepID=A0AAD6IYI9_DREDA|nr:hypothetical protein Dda_4570 [Drechslerella dactyloides]